LLNNAAIASAMQANKAVVRNSSNRRLTQDIDRLSLELSCARESKTRAEEFLLRAFVQSDSM